MQKSVSCCKLAVLSRKAGCLKYLFYNILIFIKQFEQIKFKKFKMGKSIFQSISTENEQLLPQAFQT